MKTKIQDKTRLSHLCADFNETKWSDLYNSIEDLIEDLKGIDVNSNKFRWIRGQEYIKSFQRQIVTGKILSEKQITMLKRLAKQIAKYYII